MMKIERITIDPKLNSPSLDEVLKSIYITSSPITFKVDDSEYKVKLLYKNKKYMFTDSLNNLIEDTSRDNFKSEIIKKIKSTIPTAFSHSSSSLLDSNLLEETNLNSNNNDFDEFDSSISSSNIKTDLETTSTRSLLINSWFWSEEYNNYQAYKKGAIEYLNSLWLTTSSKLKSDLIAVTWFIETEPDYGKYKHDYEAKEARSSYSAILESIVSLEEVEKLNRELNKEKKKEEDEIEKLKEEILNTLPKVRDSLQEEANKQYYEEQIKKIINISWRVYNYEYDKVKYKTYEEILTLISNKSKNAYYQDKYELEECITFATTWKRSRIIEYYQRYLDKYKE